MKKLFTIFLVLTYGVGEIVAKSPLPSPSLSTIVSHVTCYGGIDGSIDLNVSGGTAPYNFQWSNGETTEDVQYLVAGIYSVTVTDAMSNTATVTATVNEPSIIQATLSSTDVTCNGGSDGSTTVSISGGTPPYFVLWNTGVTAIDNPNVPAGDYYAIIQDNNGCMLVDEVIVNEPAPWTVIATSTDETCAGNDGSASISVSGGVTPYSYDWSNGGSNNSINNLSEGTYMVTVTDAEGCTATNSTNVSLDCITCNYANINSENFDSGWGFWSDPGSDCQRVKTSFANSPKHAVRLRGNSSSSYVETLDLNFQYFTELTVEFSYITNRYKNGHNFYLELSTDGGSTYSVVEDWSYGADFLNGQRHNEQLVIGGPFTLNTRLRLRGAASGRKDELYIDDIVLTGCYQSPSLRLSNDTPEQTPNNEEENSQISTGSSSVSFDGPGSHVNLGTNYGDSIVTIELMFKPTDTINSDLQEVKSLIIRDTPNQVDEYGIYFSPNAWGNPGKLVFYMMVNGTAYRSFSDEDVWLKDVWYHVACVNDPNSGLMKMYVNGTLQSQPETYQAAISSSSSYQTALGQWGATAGIRNFDGNIDEVRLWSTVRNSSEISNLQCLQGNETGLLRYWRFDEGTGSTAYDETVNSPALLEGQAGWSNEFGIDCSMVTSTEYPGASEGLMIYPNPTNGRIYIKNSDAISFETIVVYNALGQEVMRLNNATGINEIDLTNTNAKGLLLIQFLNQKLEPVYSHRAIVK